MELDGDFLPAQGRTAVEILLNDHRVIEDLLDELTQATESRRHAVMEQLKAVMTIHNATEEGLVYPAIATLYGNKLISRQLYHETAEADMLFFELNSLLKQSDESDFKLKARWLRDAVCDHIYEEERKAFPRLNERADRRQAEALTDAVMEFRRALHFET